MTQHVKQLFSIKNVSLFVRPTYEYKSVKPNLIQNISKRHAASI